MFVIGNPFQPSLMFRTILRVGKWNSVLGIIIINAYRGPGMSDPNKQYDRRNGNSRTVKITFLHTGLIILPSLGKLFRLIYFPKVLLMRMMVR